MEGGKGEEEDSGGIPEQVTPAVRVRGVLRHFSLLWAGTLR